LLLRGLGEEDALDWFQALMRLPPEPQVPPPQREPLRSLFTKVGFHPLSVGMLARELKMRRIAELGERLEALLAQTGSALLASLNLSLERLDPQSASYLPRLGVFQGGAFEINLMEICELDDAKWQPLRRGLEQTGLIQAENVQGFASPFLRFHPTLAAALWAKLNAEEREPLTALYRKQYYELSHFLYQQDSATVNPVRAIARRELPNLLAAVNGALDTGAPRAVAFVDNVSRFLSAFGLSRDRATLAKRAQAVVAERGSDDWSLARSNLGAQFFDAGDFRQAEEVFTDILAQIGDAPSHGRCTTLLWLGRCYQGQGHASRAEGTERRALAEAGKLEPTIEARRLIGTLQADLAVVLGRTGRYREARVALEASLAIKAELRDDRGVAVALAELGTLATREYKLDEAESRYRQALETFRGLGEPSSQAAMWHQLGLVYQRANRLQEAEQAYRESARIEEEYGNRVGAAQSWGQLARVMGLAGRPDDAEIWYVKALKAAQAEGDRANEAAYANNIAATLVGRPGRLADARRYGERALAIKRTLDPAATEIWTTYNILAEIADKSGDADAARNYRREERASYAAAPVGQEVLRRHGDLVKSMVAAIFDPSTRPALDEVLAKRVQGGWTKLVEALRRILDGDRDEDALCEPLDPADSAMVGAVLRSIADPDSLKTIPSAEPATESDAAAGVAERLETHLPLIAALVAAADEPETRTRLDPILQEMEKNGWSSLVTAIRRIIERERNPKALLAGLDEEDTLIVSAILAGIENPTDPDSAGNSVP
jgi:tetratricopeptide (TPR) repeat protein